VKFIGHNSGLFTVHHHSLYCQELIVSIDSLVNCLWQGLDFDRKSLLDVGQYFLLVVCADETDGKALGTETASSTHLFSD
jgi:hypothetical protein